MAEGGGIGPRSANRATGYKSVSSRQLDTLRLLGTLIRLLTDRNFGIILRELRFRAAQISGCQLNKRRSHRRLFSFRALWDKRQQLFFAAWS
jgi:hypothetical protein